MITKSKISKSIVQGLNEAIQFEKDSKSSKANVKSISISPLTHFKGSQVKNIRNTLNLSQRSFALLMGVSVKTVEAWEGGKNEPNGTAQRMLSLLKEDKN